MMLPGFLPQSAVFGEVYGLLVGPQYLEPEEGEHPNEGDD